MRRLPNRLPTFLAICVLLPASIAAHADDAPPKKDGQWRGTAGASLSATSGNTHSSALQLTLDMARQTGHDKVTTGAHLHYARGEVDGESTTTANRASAFGQYDFDLGPRLFAFGKLALERDEPVDLDLRTTLGTGLGWKVLEREGLRFSVSGGLAHSRDRYASAQTVDGETGTRFSRTSVLLAEESEHAFDERISFKQRLELQPALAGARSHLLQFDATLSVALNSTLALTVGLQDRYDSAPPEGRRKNDASLLMGVSLRLGSP